MEAEKALRIQIALLELISVADTLMTRGYGQFWHDDWRRLNLLTASPDYQELKNWIGGIKK